MDLSYAQEETKALKAYVDSVLTDWRSGVITVPLEKHFCSMRGYPSGQLNGLMGFTFFKEAFDMMKDVQENLITIGALQGKFKSDFALRALEELNGWRREQVSPIQANIQINNADMAKIELVMRKLEALNVKMMKNNGVGEIGNKRIEELS